MFHELTCSSASHYNHQMKPPIVRRRLYPGVTVGAFVHMEAPWLQGKAGMVRGERRAAPDHEQTAVDRPHTSPPSGEKMAAGDQVRSGDDQERTIRCDQVMTRYVFMAQVSLHGPCPAKPCQRGAKPESTVAIPEPKTAKLYLRV
jgi:hypothetical protein